jgi:cobalamin biosynthesis protein CobD/CbiB
MSSHHNNDRGRDLSNRVLRRYRNKSPLTDAFAGLLTWITGLTVVMAVGLYLAQILPWFNPVVLGMGLVVGVAIVLLVGVANRGDQRSRLWQKTRSAPIRRRRRSWLRWLTGAKTCGFCRDDLEGAVTECPACCASYHDECADELGHCGTIGCEGLGHTPVRRSKVQLQAPK